MILWTKSKNKKVLKAMEYAQRYLNSEDLKSDILSVKEFSHTTATPKEILEAFLDARARGVKVEIRVSHFGIWKKRVLGSFGSGNYFKLNSYPLAFRVVAEVMGTIVHETGHWVDWLAKLIRFGHGDNSSSGKKMAFPYFIGYAATRWCEREILRDEAALKNKQVAELTAQIIKERMAA